MRVIKALKKGYSDHRDRNRRVLAIVGDTQVGLWVVRNLARNGLIVHAIVNSEHGLGSGIGSR